MELITKILSLFGLVFLLLTMIANFLWRSFPKIPGDINLQKTGIDIYLPVISSVVITVILTIFFFNYFK